MHWKTYFFLVKLGFLILADAKGIRSLHDDSSNINLNNHNVNKNRNNNHDQDNYNKDYDAAYGRELQSTSMFPVMSPSIMPRSQPPPRGPTASRRAKNSFCRNATLIKESPFYDGGDNSISNVLGAGDQTCSLITETSSILWYRIVGSGDCVTVKTSGSYIDTVLAVYEGNCGNLTCLKQNDDSPSSGDMTSEVSWEAKEGATYHLALSGWSGNVGQIQLEYTAERCATNKYCYAADSIEELPSVVEGNYLFGSPLGRSRGNVCPGLSSSDRSLWYSMTGKEGSCYVASLNGTNSYGTTLSILSGSCRDLQCTDNRNDGFTLAWVGSNETYSIAVSGDDTLASGSFTLLVDEIDCPLKTNCNTAVSITTFPYSYESYQPFDSLHSTIGAENPALACPEIQEGMQGTWFEVKSETGCYTVSIEGYVADAVLAVYDGGHCEALTCHEALDYISKYGGNYTGEEVYRTLSWKDKNATSFKVFVAASTLDNLFYELKFEDVCRDIPVNGECSDATTIDDLPVTLFGDLTYGTSDQDYLDIYHCYLADSTQVTVWYEFVPENDTCVEASITSQHYTYMTIFSGTSCYDFDPTCIGQTSGINSTSTVLFNAQAGKKYLLRVAQTNYQTEEGNSEKGNFTLALSANDCAANDRCEDAVQVDQLPFVAEGSTHYATGESNNSSCYYLTRESPTVWFEVEASESGCLTAIVADDFTAAMAVYSGGCSSLNCVTQVGYGEDEVTWSTVKGETYKIGIGSSYSETRGDFKLIVLESDDCGSIPANSQCADSRSISSLPFTDAASTKFVDKLGDHVPFSECPNYVTYDSKGVWYSIASTSEDECFVASTQGSDFDTIIALYEGDSCSTRSCVKENDDFEGLSSRLIWKGGPDKNFSIFFGGLGTYVGILNVFVDRIPCGSDKKEGCSNPRSIDQLPFVEANDLGQNVVNSTDSPNITCSSHYSWGPNMWYKFEGKTDGCVTASIAPDSHNEIGLAIYEGDNCKNSSCAAEVDPYSVRKLATWAVSAGSTYLVAVYSSSSSARFVMTMVESDCGDVDDNKICADAMSIDDEPFVIGSNADGSIAIGGYGIADGTARLLCGTNDTLYNPLWYSVEGDGSCVSVNVLAEFTPSVMVFTGSCDTLECFLYHDGNGRLSWKSEVGEKYIISIGGLYYGSGKFNVHIEHGECAENDSCANAISVGDVQSKPFVDSGNNEFASSEELSAAFDCSRLLPSSTTSWYSYRGKGHCVTASLAAGFDSRLLVYTGACDTLQCWRQSSDGDSVLTWFASNDTDYMIAVASVSEGFGDFAFTVTSRENCEQNANDACMKSLEVGEFPYEEQTDNFELADISLHPSALVCSVVDQFDSGRWYSVEGKDDLCFAASATGGVATKAAVYEGDVDGFCEDLTCIAQTNSSYGSYESRVAWRSKTGELYHVFVAAGQGSVGEFEVYLEASECATNSNCNDAKMIDSLNLPFIDLVEPTVSVDNSNGTVGCLDQISWPKFYYEFEGTGECLSASLTAIGDSVLSLERGDCNSPICVTRTEQDEIITWMASEGETYRLLVGSRSSDFALVLSVSSQCADDDFADD